MDKLEVWVKCKTRDEACDIKETIYELHQEASGDYKVIIFISDTSEILSLTRHYYIDKSDVPKLKEMYGDDNVKVIEEFEPEPMQIELWKETNALLREIVNELEGIRRKR